MGFARTHSSYILPLLLSLGVSSAAQAQVLALAVTHHAGPLSEQELRAGVVATQPTFLACLESVSAADGIVTLRLMVSSDGAVVVAEVQEAHGRVLEQCAKRAIMTARFPARPAFTTFVVELRLGEAPRSVARRAPRGRVRLTLLLTRVDGRIRPSGARRSLNQARRRLGRCYMQEVARGGARSMRLHLVVRLGSDGRVIAAGQRGGPHLSTAFDRCLDRTLRHQAFPSPISGEAEIQQSVRFEFLSVDGD